MAVHGDLSTVNLPDVIQLIHGSRNSGILTITDDQRVVALFFYDGELLLAESNEKGQGIVDYLLTIGEISPEQERMIKESLAGGNAESLSIYEMLLKRGFLTLEELQNHLKNLSQVIVYELFTWSEGTFDFNEENTKDFLPVQIGQGLNIYNLIMEGVRRVDEWNRFTRVIESEKVIFDQSGNEEAAAINLTKEQLGVLSLVNGHRSVAQIERKCTMNKFDLWHTLFSLASVGLIVKTGEITDEDPLEKTVILNSQKALSGRAKVLITLVAFAALGMSSLFLSKRLRSSDDSSKSALQTMQQEQPVSTTPSQRHSTHSEEENRANTQSNEEQDTESSMVERRNTLSSSKRGNYSSLATPVQRSVQSHDRRTTSPSVGGIDINRASASQLTSLPRIGPAIAARIIAYRKEHRFKSKEDLMNVRGIGPKTFNNLKERIIVSPLELSHQSEGFTTTTSTEEEEGTNTQSPDHISSQQGLIDINHADAALLQTLPGIGPAMSQRIIDYRTKHKGFSNLQELIRVRGIGEKTFSRLKPLITVTPL